MLESRSNSIRRLCSSRLLWDVEGKSLERGCRIVLFPRRVDVYFWMVVATIHITSNISTSCGRPNELMVVWKWNRLRQRDLVHAPVSLRDGGGGFPRDSQCTFLCRLAARKCQNKNRTIGKRPAHACNRTKSRHLGVSSSARVSPLRTTPVPQRRAAAKIDDSTQT